MKKWMVLTAMAVGLVAWIGSSLAYENSNGLGYFALEIPPEHIPSMMVNGLDNDWGWFDPGFIYGPDDMATTLGGDMPDKSDIDIAIKAAWTPEPDNRLYVFVRVVDDQLNVDEPAMDAGWKDDDMEIILDPDHSGTFHGPNDGGDGMRVEHQQWTFHVSTPGAYPQVPYLRYNQLPEMQWAITEGYVEGEVDVQPQREHLATDVTVGYEVRMMAFDYYSPDGFDASTRHVFTAGETLGMSVTLNEADDGGRTHQISTHPNELGSEDSDYTSEFTLLSVDEYEIQTAVESSSWGAVKALFR
jgi:hypothetical protein